MISDERKLVLRNMEEEYDEELTQEEHLYVLKYQLHCIWMADKEGFEKLLNEHPEMEGVMLRHDDNSDIYTHPF